MKGNPFQNKMDQNQKYLFVLVLSMIQYFKKYFLMVLVFLNIQKICTYIQSDIEKYEV